jgi:hypothetical protein
LKSVFLIFDNDSSGYHPVGAGFFVSHHVAITACHNLQNPTVGLIIKGKFGEVQDSVTQDLAFTVARFDEQIDYCLLWETSAIEHGHLVLSSEVPHQMDQCVLAAFQIPLTEELLGVFESGHQVGFMPGRVTKIGRRHFLFDGSSFSGDSGGAVILALSQQVVGIHLETVNQARERISQASVKERLNAVEQSVDSLVRGLHSGSLALKSSIILDAVREVEAAHSMAPAVSDEKAVSKAKKKHHHI